MKSFIAFVIGLLATPLIFLLVGIMGHLPSDASSEPPHWESSLGMRALDASLERRSDGLSNTISPREPTVMAAGQAIYAHNCEGCHGSAKGPAQFGSGFYPRVPQFFQEGTDVDPKEAYAAVRDGIRYSGMPAWRTQLKDEQIWQVANFVAQIRAPNGKAMNMDRD